MQSTSISEVLRALAVSDEARSETARLRDVFDEVEAALAAGVSRAAVLKALVDKGFTMTPKSFESALYRIRKKKENRVSLSSPGELPVEEPKIEKLDGEMERPAGLSNAAWNEMKARKAKSHRK